MNIAQTRFSRMTLATFAAILGLCLLNLWAYDQLTSSGDSAELAIDNTAEANQLIGQIRDLQQRKSVATTAVFSDSDLVRRLETIAQQAQIPANRLLRVSPEAPRRQKDSPYLEQSIGLTLSQVTLPQSMQFFGKISASANGLKVRTLRLSPPSGSEIQDAWKVDATLVYYIYSPTNDPKKTDIITQ